MTDITLIPGDGNGGEIAAATRQILEAAGVAVAWDEAPLGARDLGQRTLDSLGRTKRGLLGFQHERHQRHDPPPIVSLRDAFGMYANVRPIRSLKGLPTRHEGVDLVLVREVTEDIYRHLEHESIPGVFESLKVTTRGACERIAVHAFEYARANGRKKVTIVHKANIMKKSDGMFLRTAQEVAARYPEIAVEDFIVDALCMRLVLSPGKFDVLVAGNLYGDIVADLCAGLVGGAANSASINVGPEVRVFASPHGTIGPAGAGNPLELLIPALSMIADLGETAASERIRAAVERALLDGAMPVALGGTAGCTAFTAAILERL